MDTGNDDGARIETSKTIDLAGHFIALKDKSSLLTCVAFVAARARPRAFVSALLKSRLAWPPSYF
jgi:hypothetical protein